MSVWNFIPRRADGGHCWCSSWEWWSQQIKWHWLFCVCVLRAARYYQVIIVNQTPRPTTRVCALCRPRYCCALVGASRTSCLVMRKPLEFNHNGILSLSTRGPPVNGAIPMANPFEHRADNLHLAATPAAWAWGTFCPAATLSPLHMRCVCGARRRHQTSQLNIILGKRHTLIL